MLYIYMYFYLHTDKKRKSDSVGTVVLRALCQDVGRMPGSYEAMNIE